MLLPVFVVNKVRPTKAGADECVAEVSAVAEGDTACAVDEEPVKGDTSPAAHSPEEAGVGARIEEAGKVVSPPDGHIAVTFDTEDEVVDLPVVAGLATDEEAAAVVVVVRDNQGAHWCRAPEEHRVLQWAPVIRPEGAADIRADMNPVQVKIGTGGTYAGGGARRGRSAA